MWKVRLSIYPNKCKIFLSNPIVLMDLEVGTGHIIIG